MTSDYWKHLCFKLFLTCFLFTSFPHSEEMHTKGIGFSKDAALENALKHGLERKIKASLSGNTFINDNHLLIQNFTDNVSRYILSEKIISVKDFFNCFEIEAAVEIDNLRLKQDLRAHGFGVKSISKPAIIMLIDEYHDSEKLSEQTASLTLKEIMVKNGYTILDVKQESAISSINYPSGKANITDTARIGFENGADLVIRGLVNTGKATPVDVYGKKQSTVPVQMNVEVIRTDNARIIASNTQSIRKNASNDYSALQFALKSAAEATGKKIVADLDAFCASEEYTLRHFELLVKGIEYSSAGRLESNIKTLSCINDVKLGYLENRVAVYHVSINGSLTALRNELSAGTIPGLEIESLSRGKIVASYRNDSLQIISQPADSEVAITYFQIEELYPSKIRYYATHPAGRFTLRCSSPVTDLRVSLSLPDLLIQPVRAEINKIDSGEDNIDLFIVPAIERLINIVETRVFQGNLELQYTMAGKVLTRSLSVPVTVHGVNGMNWNTPEAISCFITNNDPVVRTLSRQIVQGLTSGSDFKQDLINAIAVHTSIRNFGIDYVKDPSPASEKVIDIVQFPSQTLFHRTGDCDDLSVLHCALLSSLGIPVALLLSGDHIFYMFNTGIFEKNRLALSPDSTLTIIHDNKLWIPIEATDKHSSFVESWHTTARKYHDAIKGGRDVHIIDIQETWKRYPPVSMFENKLDISLKPVQIEIDNELQLLHNATARQYAEEIARLKSVKRKKTADHAALDNKVGLLYIRSGDYRKALRSFKRAYNIHNSSEMMSNYACALFLSGNENKALEILDNIYKKSPEGKIAVNRALCYYVASRDTASIHTFFKCMKEAVSVIKSDAQLSEILGFEINNQDLLRASNRQHTNDQKLDVTILKQYIKAASDTIKQRTLSGITTESSSGTRITGTTTETSTGTTADNLFQKLTPFGGLRGATFEDLLRLIDLLFWFDF